MKKKDTNPEIKLFIDHSYQTQNLRNGKKLYITGRCAKTVERMLQTFSFDELKGLWDKFLEIEDDFVSEAGYSIPVFESVLNKLLTGKSKKKSTLDYIWEGSDGQNSDKENNVVPLRRISGQ